MLPEHCGQLRERAAAYAAINQNPPEQLDEQALEEMQQILELAITCQHRLKITVAGLNEKPDLTGIPVRIIPAENTVVFDNGAGDRFKIAAAKITALRLQ